ncbi:MAG: ATP-binding protein, partial [Nitrospirota bacterium]
TMRRSTTAPSAYGKRPSRLSHPRKYYFNESHRNIYGMFAAAFAEILSYAKIDEELQRFNVELERRVEERTREVESYQKSIEGILLKSRDMMIVTDSRGKIKLVNPSALKLGYKKEELEGKSLETVIHPGQGDLLAALLTADGVEDFETEFIDKAGRERKILINTILLEEGHEGAYLVTARDVTEKRMFHEKLMRAERLAYIGELASGVAHEINNKLVPVLGYAELLMDDRKEEKEVRMLQRIKESAIGAKNVIQSLLKFSRQEKLEKRLSDINELLSDTVEMYRLRLKNTKIEIVTNLSPDLPRTVLDRQQMQQVAVNLINNAVHSMKNTGGKLEVSTSMSEKSGIEIRIADTGPGIPEDIAERIFDPFFTTKDVGEGTGLGLSICYGIICEHGGEINFSSRPGGTVFTVRIPVNERTGEDAPAAGKRPLSLTRSGDSSGRSILAIDDDKDQLDLLEEVLGGKYEVVTAKTGLEALQNLKNTDFDLVLTDVRMPGLNGIAVLGWIKKHKAALKDKVIFITGDTCEPSLHKFIEENGVPALAKPYNIGDLLETVEEVLSGPREGATAVFF